MFVSQGTTKNESAINSSPGDKASDSDVSKTDDVMIKTVRVIANLSINETVGPQIASSSKCVLLLLNILGMYMVQNTWFVYIVV